MIIIHAYIEVKPEHQIETLEKAYVMVVESRKEKENISYSLFQDPKDKNKFIILEKWENEEAIKFHNKTNHFNEFIHYLKAVISQPLNIEQYSV